MSDKDNKDLDNTQRQDEDSTSENTEHTELNDVQVGQAETEEASNEPVQALNDRNVVGIQETAPVNPSGLKTGKVWPIVSLVLAIVLIIVLIKPPFVSSKQEAVATVNGVEISKDTFYDRLVKVNGDQTLNEMIEKELVNQEAKKANIKITQADLDEEMKNYIKSFGSEETLNQALASYGMTKEDLYENMDMNMKLTKLLEPQIKVTDEQIKQTFDENKESFNTPEQVRTSVIVVATEDEAKEIVKQLKEGTDFAELAKSKSLDALTKDSGGDTNFFGRGEIEEAVENAVFKLQKDEISEPVKTSRGYEVYKLTDRKEAHEATLEEKKEEIRKGLVAQQVSQLAGTWLEDTKAKAKITNTLTDAAASEDAAANNTTTNK
ncbi:Foldase protein PrsA 1 precursor [compost metagenome]